MVAELVTPQEMSTWTETDIGTLSADPFAKEVREKVSNYLRFLAGHPEWTLADAPYDVRVIAIWMVKRTYTNPDQETSTNVGPLGSRVLDDAALGMALSDSERAVLQGYKDKVEGTGAQLYTMSITSALPALQPVIFLPDDQQVNLGDLDPWMIPYLEPDDVNNPVAP